jgi:hypothetical protein
MANKPVLEMDKESTSIYLGELSATDTGTGQIRVNHIGGVIPFDLNPVIQPAYPFGGITGVVLNYGEFPAVISIQVDADTILYGQHYIPQEWIVERTTHGSTVVERDYTIPMEVWLAGQKNMFDLSFRITFIRESKEKYQGDNPLAIYAWLFIVRVAPYAGLALLALIVYLMFFRP